MSTKIAQLERLLADLVAGKIRGDQAERLFFNSASGEQIRLNRADAPTLLRERIEKERGG